ncbi:hypothetical protein [Nocardioides daejeonensis]|uniref:hypothetical protein n=1 Tax=Nocardioides daejeonensis TaxID=1046556 RepID=UPI0013A5A68B|nr:hypothetical protein [Nocardioides daejeonensis]
MIRRRPSSSLPRGERALATALDENGTPVVGSRRALYLGEHRVPWEQVHRADWDPEEERLAVSEVGEFGRERPVHVLVLTQPGRLLELVRERVTATMLVQRHVPIVGDKGVFVIARRASDGSGVTWYLDFQPGVDPADPEVRRAAREALAAVRDDVGM